MLWTGLSMDRTDEQHGADSHGRAYRSSFRIITEIKFVITGCQRGRREKVVGSYSYYVKPKCP